MSTETKQPAESAETSPNLQARYKPLGLRAVVAATQCKPEVKAQDKRRTRDLKGVLQLHYD